MSSSERRVLESVCDAARSAGKLTEDQWERLRSTFGDRFGKAWRLLEERRVKRYVFEPSGKTMWIVIGRSGEYQVLPASGYCGCGDFYFRVVDGEAGVCHHLIAQRLADCLGACDDVSEEDEFLPKLMAEWRSQSLKKDDGA